MTSGWSITQGVTTVALPVAPKILDDKNPVQIDEVGVDGGGSVLASRFTMARSFTMQGSIWVHGASNATLESTYLAPLRAMKRLQVTITDPDSQYSGYWLMGEADFHRVQEGTDVRYTFNIEFKQSSRHVVY